MLMDLAASVGPFPLLLTPHCGLVLLLLPSSHAACGLVLLLLASLCRLGAPCLALLSCWLLLSGTVFVLVSFASALPSSRCAVGRSAVGGGVVVAAWPCRFVAGWLVSCGLFVVVLVFGCFLVGGLGWVLVFVVWLFGFCVGGLGCWVVVGVVAGRWLCCCPLFLSAICV